MGPYPVSVKQAWLRRHEKNLLFIFYEELKQDLRGSLQRLANFFGKGLTNEQLDKLQDHLSIKSMKKNKAVNMTFFKDTGAMSEENNFIRKGIVGDYKNVLSPETVAKFDIWWKNHMGNEECNIPTFN